MPEPPVPEPQGDMPPMDGQQTPTDMPPAAAEDMQQEPAGEEPEIDDMPVDEPKANSEIDDIFNKLDTEKQAAVIKYAKSMTDDDNEEPEGKEPGMDGMPEDMPMESRKKLGKMISEIVNNILSADDTNDDDDRRDGKIRNSKVSVGNPFVAARGGKQHK